MNLVRAFFGGALLVVSISPSLWAQGAASPDAPQPPVLTEAIATPGVQGRFDHFGFDGKNQLAFPGCVDAHMHIGIYSPLAEDALTESKAAAMGGVTVTATPANSTITTTVTTDDTGRYAFPACVATRLESRATLQINSFQIAGAGRRGATLQRPPYSPGRRC